MGSVWSRGGSCTLYFVFADVDVRCGLDDVACEVVDHLEDLMLCPFEDSPNNRVVLSSERVAVFVLEE